jgi:hypothetical protein
MKRDKAKQTKRKGNKTRQNRNETKQNKTKRKQNEAKQNKTKLVLVLWGAVNAQREGAPMSTRSPKFIIPIRSISGGRFLAFFGPKNGPFFYI